MNVLLTNDDGIHAPGLRALHDALRGNDERLGDPIMGADGELLVVAPLSVQSATSHGVTFREPLMIREEVVSRGCVGVGVEGRPADCVKLALSSLWPERLGVGSRPDLVISGMNAGANCGINVIYSGTVAAALEAAFLGLPAIAVSLHIGPGRPRFDVAARHAREVIDRLVAVGLEPHDCLNVNIPVTQEERDLPPIRVCPMNTHGLVDSYERRESPRGDVYYWAAGHGLDFHDTAPGSDVDALMNGAITVTPLRYDLTAETAVHSWAMRIEEG